MAVLRDCFGLLRPGRVLEVAPRLLVCARKTWLLSLGSLQSLEVRGCSKTACLRFLRRCSKFLAARVSRFAGWAEAEVLSALVEGHQASAVFTGLLRAGFDLRSPLEEILRSRGQFPTCSDPVLLWFFGALSSGECLGHVCSGRGVSPPRDVSLAGSGCPTACW